VRVEVRCKYDQNGKNTWGAAAGPADTAYGFMTLMARLMDGFERHARGRAFRWFGIPAGFGRAVSDREFVTYPNGIPLLNHPADRLRSGRRGPFFATGLRRNREWSREFLGHLAEELAFRRLPDPIALILTSENGVGDDYAGHGGNPDTGWVPEALADPRADDPEHTLDGRRTFAQYMAQARTIDGAPIPTHRDDAPMALPAGRSPINDESSERYHGAIRLAWDWSRERAFSSLARDAFRRDPARPERTVPIGEYQAACDSPRSPVRIRPRTLLHQMNGLFRTDLQCPDWFGGIPWLHDTPAFDAADPGWDTIANWLRVYPNGETDPARRRRRLALDIHTHIASAHAASAPHAPLAPFVFNGDEAFEDDMVEYLRHCRARGAWCVIVFMPKPDRAAHDYWLRVIPRVCA
jgi:hypothetical protein